MISCCIPGFLNKNEDLEEYSCFLEEIKSEKVKENFFETVLCPNVFDENGISLMSLLDEVCTSKPIKDVFYEALSGEFNSE
eukprot:Pgem_evm1s6036